MPGRERRCQPAHVARYDAKDDADALGEVELLQSLGLGPRMVDLRPALGSSRLLPHGNVAG